LSIAPAARGPPSEVCGSRTQIHSFNELHVAIGAFGGASILTGWRTLRHRNFKGNKNMGVINRQIAWLHCESRNKIYIAIALRLPRFMFNPLRGTLKPQSKEQRINFIQQYGDWYTGRWVGCYSWYSEEGSGRIIPCGSGTIIALAL